MVSWQPAELWEEDSNQSSNGSSSQAPSDTSSQFFDVEASEDIHPDPGMERAVPVQSAPLSSVNENVANQHHDPHNHSNQFEQLSPRRRRSQASKDRMQRRANGGLGMMLLLTATIGGVLLGATLVHYLNRGSREVDPGVLTGGGKNELPVPVPSPPNTRQPSTIVAAGETTERPTISIETHVPTVTPTAISTIKMVTTAAPGTKPLPPCPCCESWHNTTGVQVKDEEIVCYNFSIAVAGQCSRAFRSDEFPEFGCHKDETLMCVHYKPPICQVDFTIGK